MSNSKSEFIPTDDGLKVFVEHGDFGPETLHFIHGIAAHMWHSDPEPEEVGYSEDGEDAYRQYARAYRQWHNPTLRYWKRHQSPKKPSLHLTKGRFRFVPPPSMCLLGPGPQYKMVGEGRDSREVLQRHPACACVRCRDYNGYRELDFWLKITGRIQVEV